MIAMEPYRLLSYPAEEILEVIYSTYPNRPTSSTIVILKFIFMSNFNFLLLDRISSTPSVFTSDEYRAWLSRVPASLLPRSSSTLSRTGTTGLSSISRTPSTSAIYERIRAGREAITQQRAQRFTFSAENLSLLDRHREVRIIFFFCCIFIYLNL